MTDLKKPSIVLKTNVPNVKVTSATHTVVDLNGKVIYEKV